MKETNYYCVPGYDFSNIYVHPIRTSILGVFLTFWPLFVDYIIYLILMMPIPSFFNNTGFLIAFSIAILTFAIVFNIFYVIPIIWKNVKVWITSYSTNRKLPLMSIGYRKSYILVNNLENFYPSNIRIRLNEEYCITPKSYYGVDKFLGFFHGVNGSNQTAFKGNFFATFVLINSCFVYNAKEKINSFGKKHNVKILKKKKDKEVYKDELQKNEQDSINKLLKSIQSKKNKSINQINSAVNLINEALNHD